VPFDAGPAPPQWCEHTLGCPDEQVGVERLVVVVGLEREPDPRPASEHGTTTAAELVEPYLEHALGVVGDADLTGVTVAYDAMHGSGRGVTDRLLERAGADVIRLRCDRDPTFGGSSPEPTGERLGDLVDAVVDGPADIGVANDGDADRVRRHRPARCRAGGRRRSGGGHG